MLCCWYHYFVVCIIASVLHLYFVAGITVVLLVSFCRSWYQYFVANISIIVLVSVCFGRYQYFGAIFTIFSAGNRCRCRYQYCRVCIGCSMLVSVVRCCYQYFNAGTLQQCCAAGISISMFCNSISLLMAVFYCWYQ